MKRIQANIPNQLFERIDELVKQGWFPSREAIIKDALQRFVDTHRPEILERFIREDVEWGLRGGK